VAAERSPPRRRRSRPSARAARASRSHTGTAPRRDRATPAQAVASPSATQPTWKPTSTPGGVASTRTAYIVTPIGTDSAIAPTATRSHDRPNGHQTTA
jgi:hypothetical protein